MEATLNLGHSPSAPALHPTRGALSYDVWMPAAGSRPLSPGLTVASCRGTQLDMPRAGPSTLAPASQTPARAGAVLGGSRFPQDPVTIEPGPLLSALTPCIPPEQV